MIQTIKDFKYAEPFEPFDIELSSGRGAARRDPRSRCLH
jgi:hypothetical protein